MMSMKTITHLHVTHRFLRGPVALAALCALAIGLESCQSAGKRYPPGLSDSLARNMGIWEEERQEEAAAEIERVLLAAPSPDPYLWYDLALRYKRTGQMGKAMECMERAIAADPSFALAFYARGTMRLWDMGESDADEEAGMADLRTAAALRPADAEIVLTLIEQLRWKEGARAEIETLFKGLLQGDQSDPEAYRVRAELSLAWDEKAAAADNARQALALIGKERNSGQRAYHMKHLVPILYQVGMEADADALVADIMASDLEDAWLYWSLGSACFDAGRYSEARAAVEAGRSHDPLVPLDMEFISAISALLARGTTDAALNAAAARSLRLVAEGHDDWLSRSAALFALKGILNQSDGIDRAAFEAEFAEKWGPLEEHRADMAWLDALLKLADNR
jgi:hypothetical protein